jgi:hypothetical protein
LANFERNGSRIAALAGKIALLLRILRTLEIDPVLWLYLRDVAAIQSMVLLGSTAAY